MNRRLGLISIILILFIFPLSSFSVTINVPSDQPTIQAGIDAAVDGDTVLVADGIYSGNGNRDIAFGSKQVVVKSENGPDVTIIDCQGSETEPHRGFIIRSNKISGATIDGLQIINGYAPFDYADGKSAGGCILSVSSEISFIKNCILRDSQAKDFGGAVASDSSSPWLDNCQIINNSAGECGGGAYWNYSRGVPLNTNVVFDGNMAKKGGATFQVNLGATLFVKCTFNSNVATNEGGGIYSINSAQIIERCEFRENSAQTGGGLFIKSPKEYNLSSGNINNCTLIGNSAHSYGGGLVIQDGAHQSIKVCTIASNNAPIGAGLYFSNVTSTLSNCIIALNVVGGGVYCDSLEFYCCDIYGNEGGDWTGYIVGQAETNGNFSLDPVFCDPDNNDFNLSYASPCVSDNNSCNELIGAMEAACHIGYICGDTNYDSEVTVSDIIYLINYYFNGGQKPNPFITGNLNCDDRVDLIDILLLNSHLFHYGEARCCQ